MNINKLSVIIICKNEEKNIERCLNSVKFADEVILVDSNSTDNTLAIANTFPHVKIFSIEWGGFVKNKQYAIEQTKNDWVLWLDADEVVTEALAEEWRNAQFLNSENSIAAISVCRKTFFLGHLVKHCGWYPDIILRFFHKKRAQFNENILHESLVIQKNYSHSQFSSFLLHYSYNSLFQYFYKMNAYGLAGAQEMQRKGKKILFIRIFLSPFWAFFRSYVLKKGFLDGLVGIIICVGAGFSNFIKYSNYFFLRKYGYVENTPQ